MVRRPELPVGRSQGAGLTPGHVIVIRITILEMCMYIYIYISVYIHAHTVTSTVDIYITVNSDVVHYSHVIVMIQYSPTSVPLRNIT